MSVGENIKKYRKLKGLKQSELAELSSISRVSIGNYERGDRTPNIDTVGKIATALGIQVNDLIDNYYNLECDDDKLIMDSYARNGYLPVKESELLRDIAFIAENKSHTLYKYTSLLDWLTCDEQEEIMNFLITSFKVKFAEIYSGDRKESIDSDIKEIDCMLKNEAIFMPDYAESENINQIACNMTLNDLESAGFNNETIKRFENIYRNKK